MKTVILAGGMGTRLSEETTIKPKPMVEISNKPLLWHIMNIYSAYGFNEFVIALGYKGEVIKEYFLNYYHHQSDLSIDLRSGKITAKNENIKNWVVDLVDTGLNSMTGGRIFRLRDKLKKETFMATYGDGVANINIKDLLNFHRAQGKKATVTAVRPPARFGGMVIDKDMVIDFKEKPQIGEGWINGGFFVFEPEIFDYLDGEMSVLEADPMENLVKDKQLAAYCHDGFWHCMDTMRDKNALEAMWEEGKAGWKVW